MCPANSHPNPEDAMKRDAKPPTREMDRARTYPGIARAMAEAWG